MREVGEAFEIPAERLRAVSVRGDQDVVQPVDEEARSCNLIAQHEMRALISNRSQLDVPLRDVGMQPRPHRLSHEYALVLEPGHLADTCPARARPRWSSPSTRRARTTTRSRCGAAKTKP